MFLFFLVAQLVKHCANSAKVVGSILKEDNEFTEGFLFLHWHLRWMFWIILHCLWLFCDFYKKGAQMVHFQVMRQKCKGHFGFQICVAQIYHLYSLNWLGKRDPYECASQFKKFQQRPVTPWLTLTSLHLMELTTNNAKVVGSIPKEHNEFTDGFLFLSLTFALDVQIVLDSLWLFRHTVSCVTFTWQMLKGYIFR